MSKKDRIAIVVSILIPLPMAIIITDISRLNGNGGLMASAFIIFVYWGYRFIKNDISFLDIKEDENNTL